MALLSNAQSLRAGIQKALSATWKQQFPVYRDMQKSFLHYLPYTNIRDASYGFKQRVPFPKPLPYGKGRTHQGLQDVAIDVNLFPYELTVSWDERDATDDQIGDLEQHVSQSVERFLQLPDVLIGEYMSGVPVYNHNGLNLAYDGVSLYSALDGDGANRFNTVGGNVLLGSGVSNTAKVLGDIQAVRRRFLQFKEPVTGQPLHNPADITYNRMHFVIPPQLDAVFHQLNDLERIYGDTAINTNISNLVKSKVKYTVNQRLTDTNDWFAVVETKFWKPFAYRAPQNVRQLFSNLQNSDRARESFEVGVFLDMRLGITPWAPFTTIKVDNT